MSNLKVLTRSLFLLLLGVIVGVIGHLLTKPADATPITTQTAVQTSVSQSRPTTGDFLTWLSDQPGVSKYEDCGIYQLQTSALDSFTAVADINNQPVSINIPSNLTYYPVPPLFVTHVPSATIYYASQPIKVPEQYRFITRPYRSLYGYCFAELHTATKE